MSVAKGNTQIPYTGLAPVDGYSWSRTAGPAVKIWYKGTYAAMMAKVPTLQVDFDTIDITRINGQGEFWRLDAAQVGDTIQHIYEVNGSDLTQPRSQNLKLLKTFTDAGLTGKEISTVANCVEGWRSGIFGTDYKQLESKIFDALFAAGADPSFISTTAMDFADDLIRGGDNFLQSQFTFKHSIVCAERIWAANAGDFANVFEDTGKIHEETDMRTAEAIPASFILPKSISQPTQPAVWLKRPPRVELTYNQKRTLTVEYLCADQWSSLYYEHV